MNSDAGRKDCINDHWFIESYFTIIGTIYKSVREWLSIKFGRSYIYPMGTHFGNSTRAFDVRRGHISVGRKNIKFGWIYFVWWNGTLLIQGHAIKVKIKMWKIIKACWRVPMCIPIDAYVVVRSKGTGFL